MKIKESHTIIILIALILYPLEVFATCDSCFLPRTGRDSGYSLGADSKGAFFDFRYEYQNWDSINAEAEQEGEEHDHSSHEHEEVDTHSTSLRSGSAEEVGGHEDSHGHNRTQDRIYHFSGGYNFSDTFSVLFHLPYNEKFVLEDSGAENSEGFGDLSMVATWRVIKSDNTEKIREFPRMVL